MLKAKIWPKTSKSIFWVPTLSSFFSSYMQWVFSKISHSQSANLVLQVRKEITTLGALGAEQRGAKIWPKTSKSIFWVPTLSSFFSSYMQWVFFKISHSQSANLVLQVRKEITTLSALGSERRGAKIAKNANFQIDIARDRK